MSLESLARRNRVPQQARWDGCVSDQLSPVLAGWCLPWARVRLAIEPPVSAPGGSVGLALFVQQTCASSTCKAGIETEIGTYCCRFDPGGPDFKWRKQ